MSQKIIKSQSIESFKAKLQEEGIFFLIHLFTRDISSMEKLEIEETKTTSSVQLFKTDIIEVGLVFSIYNFFIKNSSQANKSMRFSFQ